MEVAQHIHTAKMKVATVQIVVLNGNLTNTKSRRLNTMCDKIVNFLCGGTVIAVAWFIASYIDVVTHNTSTCVYASWNILTFIF